MVARVSEGFNFFENCVEYVGITKRDEACSDNFMR